jgi:hypothetical protein
MDIAETFKLSQIHFRFFIFMFEPLPRSCGSVSVANCGKLMHLYTNKQSFFKDISI